MKKILAAAALSFSASAMPASAATIVFNSTFEGLANGPTSGSYVNVPTADGWTGGPGGIELQNNVAGAPASSGGSVFVELDADANSFMTRTIGAGSYILSFLYSPRPGISSESNPIQVLLNGNPLNPPGTVTAAGLGGTSWSEYTTNTFTAAEGSVLTFQAVGTSDSLGGYIDNIVLSAAPEPATWGMMIVGFGIAGGALRRRTAKPAYA